MDRVLLYYRLHVGALVRKDNASCFLISASNLAKSRPSRSRVLRNFRLLFLHCGPIHVVARDWLFGGRNFSLLWLVLNVDAVSDYVVLLGGDERAIGPKQVVL